MLRPSLTLYTAGYSRHVTNTGLIDLLKSIELIGKSINTSEFLTGSSFFSHIAFLGCAPNIALDPEQGPQHIRITVPELSKPELFAGSRTPAPLCPACNQVMVHWQHHVEESKNGEILCLRCNELSPVSHLNFRKRACFAKHLIHIAPVFESEAMPSDGLVHTLSEAFKARFSYAFIG